MTRHHLSPHANAVTCWLFILGIGIPVTLQVKLLQFLTVFAPFALLTSSHRGRLLLAVLLITNTLQVINSIASANMWLSISGS